MIECSLRKLASNYNTDYSYYMTNCTIRFKLLKIQRYRYYKSLYEGRIKFLENVIERCSDGE